NKSLSSQVEAECLMGNYHAFCFVSGHVKPMARRPINYKLTHQYENSCILFSARGRLRRCVVGVAMGDAGLLPDRGHSRKSSGRKPAAAGWRVCTDCAIEPTGRNE